MSQKYVLPCPCGLFVYVEASQAGQQVTCSCGTTQQVPALMQMRKLPVADEPAANKEGGTDTTATGNMRRAFFWIGIVVLVPAALFLLWAVFLSRPLPRDVSLKRVEYSYGQMQLFQDSTPIPEREHMILWMHEDIIDRMTPMELYFYFLNFRLGPNFSYNFQDNYQALKDAWHIRMTAGCVLTFLGLLSLVSSCFMPKRDAVVTGWSGTEWS